MKKTRVIFVGLAVTICASFVMAFSINSEARNVGAFAERPIMSILGDSISSYYGYGESVIYYGPNGTDVNYNMREEDTWWRRYIDGNGYRLGWNCGVGFGHASIPGTDYLSFSYPQRVNRLSNGGTPDYIAIYGGTNDVSISHIDVSSFSKGYNKLISKLHTLFPETKLILIGQGYFIPQFKEGDNTSDIVDGYNNAIRKIANKNDDYYVDLRGALDSPKYFDDTYVHPNEEGMKAIEAVVKEAIGKARGITGIEDISIEKEVCQYIFKINAYDRSYDNLRFRFKLVNDRTEEVIYDTPWQNENCHTLSQVDPRASYIATAEIDNNNDGIAEASLTRQFSNLYLDKPITEYNGVDYSNVYDYSYYVWMNPDLYNTYREDSKGAIEHFVKYGMDEGRHAKETFDVMSYRNQYDDLRRIFGWNNLSAYYNHYMTYGMWEGRSGTGCDSLQNPLHTFWGVDYSAVYDYEYYNNHNYDLILAFGGDDEASFYHFLSNGIYEGRQASSNFNIWTYMVNNPDLCLAFGWNIPSYLTHYIYYGQYEGRIAI